MSTILICTVGGSHEPILTAISQVKPEFVCFVCSGTDPATGRKGSEIQITGKGSIIRARPSDEHPTLPNIPAQATLDEAKFEILIVPADNFDRAFGQIREKLQSLLNSCPSSRILADYTGGTKTMTAALVTAAIETEGVELQLVTGARANLIRVDRGTEYGIPVSVERIRIERSMRMCLKAWERFGYGEAAAGLSLIVPPNDSELRARLQTARDLSQAFEAWDRFDHTEAYRLLEIYRQKIGGTLFRHLDSLKFITSNGERSEAYRLLDLWLNAERCAARRRYDDAVARAYRLIEWTAQWILRSRHQIDTSDVKQGQIPPSISLPPNKKGNFQAALLDAWRLIEVVGDGPAAEFIRLQQKIMLSHLEARNNSIFAHGFKPIASAEWENLYTWMKTSFIPMVKAEAQLCGCKTDLPQLPDRFVW